MMERKRYGVKKSAWLVGFMAKDIGISRLLVVLLCLANIGIDLGAADFMDEMPDLRTIPTPPSFKHEPNPHTLYFVVDTGTSKSQHDSGIEDSLKERRLVCEADGYPEPRCEWLKDKQPLNVEANGRIVRQEGTGTITISRMTKADEGEYQCHCENGNGTAYDRPIVLKQTYIDYFPPVKMETIQVEMGEPFSKTCTPPDSVPAARVFWIYMGAGKGTSSLTAFNSINSSHIAMNDQGTIFLQYVKEEEGPPELYFTCTVENMELSDYKFGDQFKLQSVKSPGQRFPPYIEPKKQYVSPKEITALKGESFELFCIYSGFPVQTPVWRKQPRDEIDWSRVTWGTNFNKSLKIENVVFEDEGIYECTFRDDPMNFRREEFRVHVDAAPYWVGGPPESRNSSEGETEHFNCSATGRPAPRYTFYKNGKEIVPDNHRIQINGQTLLIYNLRKGENGEGDNAVYQCKAENQYGSVWANFYLNLLAFKPVLLAPPGDTVSIIGKDPTLSCKFFGSPRPNVTWRTPAILGSKENEADNTGVHRLRLHGVTKGHEGDYECYAENKHGNATGTGTLTVRRPTRLTSYPLDETIVAGKTLELPCKAEWDPHLTVVMVWLKYGVPLNASNGRYIVDKNNTLRIDGVVGSDSGEYTCAAETRYDRADKTARIIVKDVPPPPQSVHVQCDSKSAAVNFHYVETSQDAPAREFWAQYNIDPENEPENWETHPAPVTQLNDNGFSSVRVSLYPFGNFSFRVFARNDVGDSAPTLALQRCRTEPAKPERNPGNVLVKGNTPEDVTVYWEPMARREWNGPKFHYVVQYNQVGHEPTEVTVEDPYRNSVVITANEPYSEYEVSVRARNEQGDSTSWPQKVRGFSGEEKPKRAPTGFIGKPLSQSAPTAAKFTWDEYDGSDFKGHLKGFKIEHWVESNKRAEPIRKVALFDPAAKQGIIYDLKPYAVNKARIMAYSAGGDGPPSDEQVLQMPEGVPSEVQHLEAFALSPSEVGVIWRPPREMNGVFRGYNVSWCRVKTAQDPFPPCVSVPHYITETYYRITGLESDVEYQVVAVGHTNAGMGEPTSATVRTLPLRMDKSQKPPEAPSVHESGIGEDHVNVTWLPGKFNPNDGRPLGDDHYAEYRMKGEEQWIKVPHQGKNFTIQVSGLYPGTTYEVRTVSVVNSESAGKLESRSNMTDVTTAGEAPSSASTVGWLIAIIVAILILIIILILVCLVVRNRGAKYPVSEKEKEQGREPMLKEEKGFGEYAKPGVDEEKRSLTAESKPESETDSMAEYGDGETGRFTEDGSFIGQYSAPNKVLAAPSGASQTTPSGGAERGGKNNLSTFV